MSGQHEHLTVEQYSDVAVRPDIPGIMVRQHVRGRAATDASGNAVWWYQEIYWPSWRHWKFGQRCPEHVWLGDAEQSTHKEIR